MAGLPTDGVTDGTWGAEMNAYLSVDHDAEGNNDTPTNGVLWPIDGTDTRVFTKYLTATITEDTTTKAHGVTAGNILAVSVIVQETSILWRAGGFGAGDQGAGATLSKRRYDITFDASNISINNMGDLYIGDTLTIKIDYTV